MRLVQVLGAGCPKCAKLFENAQDAVAQSGIQAKVEKVSDMDVITEFRVIATPALVIDGEVKAVGRLLTTHEIKRLLTDTR